MTARWQLHRAGLFNFWYYDNEIFEFQDGKLLLRGSNGSGKSVTMQSLLPVLLDGKKSPDRLDPFGSRSRRMADYLLGEKEVSNRDERTGYLFLEYKKTDSEQYFTTGIGMQAKRNQALKSWGFVLTDNRRIGHDLQLYKIVQQHGEKQEFPLSQTELTTAIGSGGEVVTSNLEYMKLVNRYIFGFETLEAFDDLIKLLIQLRSPKLSKDFKPTVISEILEEALPPLTDEDLRYLSDSIEQMDQTKQQMEQLEREVQALRKLTEAYEAYAERNFVDQVIQWKQAKERAQRDGQEVQRLQAEMISLEAELASNQTRKRELSIQKSSLEAKKRRLEKHEIFQLEEALQEQIEAQQELQSDLASQGKKLELKSKRERETRRSIDELELETSRQARLLAERIEDLAYEAGESAFTEHELNVQDYERNKGEDFAFDNWKREIEAHITQLEAVLAELRQRDVLSSQFQDKNRELGDLQREYDTLQEDKRKWEQLLLEEKQALIHRIHVWNEGHAHYAVTPETLQHMMRMIDDLDTTYDFDEVKGLFLPYVHSYDQSLMTKRAQLISQADTVQAERNDVQEKWNILRNQADPEPDRDQATIAVRQQLNEKSIDHAPLYELVEFKPNIPGEVQKRLESALTETGLLDALITVQEIDIQHDRILIPEPKLLTQTLADYLQADSRQSLIPVERIEAILQSIEMNGEAPVYVTEDGGYRLGSLHGHALPLDEVRFIGREARKRYRQQLLAELEEKMADCDRRQGQVQLEQQQVEDLLQQSKVAWSQFPGSNDVKACLYELGKVQANLHVQEEQMKKASAQLLALDRQLQESKQKLFHLSQRIALTLDVETYEQAVQLSRNYERALAHLHREHEHWLRLLQDRQRAEGNLAELEQEVLELRGEQMILEDKLAKVEQAIGHIQEQQRLQGAEEVRREIKDVSTELQAVEEESTRLLSAIPKQEAEQERLAEKLAVREAEHHFWSQMEHAWLASVQQEWKRGALDTDDEEWNESVLDTYASKKGLKDKSALEAQLTSLFYGLQPDLTEHKMTKYTSAPELLAWMKEIEKEEWKPIVEQWQVKNTRTIIEFDQRGLKIAPATLYQSVSLELSIQETRLDELDKELYEEILLNSVGHKLRARIRRAEQWTEKMRGLMESRDTSSGLKFSIRWKPKTADSEQELDTNELVALLKQDASLLNETDLGRITNHFRSKIQAAKTWLEEKGEGQTLLQVLKMVLDYRKWFSFVLYFERTNEPRRELTNHHFFKFSGGEKAMAMYIPLFTACYSRYQEAAPYAPFIISLDEAFAGVDENNINEMFEIVEQLGFNYIMNSQVLWGDYETVQALSVCELVRPKNADYVTVIRYTWNGQTLSLKLDEESEQMDEEGDQYEGNRPRSGVLLS